MIYTVNKLSYGRDGASRGPTDLRRSRVGWRAGGRGVGRMVIGRAGGSGWRWIGNRRGAHYTLLQRWSGMRASGLRPVGTRTFYYFIVPVLYIIFCTFYFHFTATTVQRVYVSSSSSASTAAAAAATAEYTII